MSLSSSTVDHSTSPISRKTFHRGAVQIQLSTFAPETGIKECHLLLSVTEGELSFTQQVDAVQETYLALLGTLPQAKAIFRRYYLSDSANQIHDLTERERKLPICAVSSVEQTPLNGTKIALWSYLQTDVQTKSLTQGTFEVTLGDSKQIWTGGLTARSKPSSGEQTHDILQAYTRLLERQSCTLEKNCVRTWFFLQNIDSTYAGLVSARRELFARHQLTADTHYITSTGIEGRHADPAVLVQMDGLAVTGLQAHQIQYLYAPRHLNPTHEYGVTFERGVALHYEDRTQIFISGTASIDARGEIVHPGDVLKQLDRVFENVAALLQETQADLGDILQAILYLRDPADAGIVTRHIEEKYPELPILLVHGPVCRPGWLVEMECIATQAAPEVDLTPLTLDPTQATHQSTAQPMHP